MCAHYYGHRNTFSHYRSIQPFQLTGELQTYNGWLVQAPGRAEIYLIDNGKKRWITDYTLFKKLFTGEPRETFGLDSIPNGLNIQPGTGLFRTEFTGGKVFWLDVDDSRKVVKRHITSPSAMDKYHFNWNSIIPVYGYFANGIPDGIPVA
ncbi:hypothetical protein [Paenibacillus tepidiphilus]|uniref:hypothetical protein n=1 Tax=Paenibacillus tepidiphilus TaxID=2608683 RepID=UPI001239B110|nr:hypothetical protein [Paenibacillus tepidiphilus]